MTGQRFYFSRDDLNRRAVSQGFGELGGASPAATRDDIFSLFNFNPSVKQWVNTYPESWFWQIQGNNTIFHNSAPAAGNAVQVNPVGVFLAYHPSVLTKAQVEDIRKVGTWVMGFGTNNNYLPPGYACGGGTPYDRANPSFVIPNSNGIRAIYTFIYLPGQVIGANIFSRKYQVLQVFLGGYYIRPDGSFAFAKLPNGELVSENVPTVWTPPKHRSSAFSSIKNAFRQVVKVAEKANPINLSAEIVKKVAPKPIAEVVRKAQTEVQTHPLTTAAIAAAVAGGVYAAGASSAAGAASGAGGAAPAAPAAVAPAAPVASVASAAPSVATVATGTGGAGTLATVASGVKTAVDVAKAAAPAISAVLPLVSGGGPSSDVVPVHDVTALPPAPAPAAAVPKWVVPAALAAAAAFFLYGNG